MLSEKQLAYIEQMLSPEYCLRCNSTIGSHNKERYEGFCTVCWETRQQIPLELRLILVMILKGEQNADH